MSSGGEITVTVDGKTVLSTAVAVPSTALPAFTAATGTGATVQAVTGVSVSATVGSIPPPGGGWSYNGAAHMSGAATALDEATPNVAGTVIYPHAVATSGLTAQFNITIGGGTGANGLTFALLRPGTPASSVGAGGGEFGLGGLSGVAVVLSTFPADGIDSSNFISIIGSSPSGLTVITALAPLEQLRSGLHTITVAVGKASTGSLITVSMDGDVIISRIVNLPLTALPAFTGATGP